MTSEEADPSRHLPHERCAFSGPQACGAQDDTGPKSWCSPVLRNETWAPGNEQAMLPEAIKTVEEIFEVPSPVPKSKGPRAP